MGSFDRKVRRSTESELVTEAQQRLPVGKVVSAPVKGEFRGLPLMGWISLRKNSEVRLLMLALLLIRDEGVKGILHVEIPIYPETETDAIRLLQSFGWDGRTWPTDPGWPTGTDDEANHKHFLEQSGLVASLVFPPVEGGSHATMNVDIQRAKGNFFMPPLPEAAGEPDPKLVARFQEICQDFKVFYPTQASTSEKRDHGEVLH
jgi:hypothetical protein